MPIGGRGIGAVSTTTKLVAVLVLVLLIGGLSYWILDGSGQPVAPQSSAPAPSAPATTAPAAPPAPTAAAPSTPATTAPAAPPAPTAAAPSTPATTAPAAPPAPTAAAPSTPATTAPAAPPASTAAAPSTPATTAPGSAAGPDGRGTINSRDNSPGSAAGLDGRGTISSRDNSPGELARGGRDVGSKPTANPRSTASRGLLQGARGRYFRAIDPRGNPPLSARDRGRHHWLPHGRRGQPLGQPVTVLRRPAGASITCRPPRPRRVPMPAAIASVLCGLLCTAQPGAHQLHGVTAGACRPRCAHPSCRHVRRHRG